MSAARTEIWLRNNRRALALGMLGPLLIASIGVALVPLSSGDGFLGRGSFYLGILLVVFGTISTSLLLVEISRPRLAYRDGHLLVRLRNGPPVRVPIEIVECFLLGQGPSMLTGHYDPRDTSTIVVRLDERAEDWAQVEVKPALGSWCGGHITIRGTWCEPLNVDFVRRLNARLAEVQRAAQQMRVAG
ncbi:MAG: hypothetical protein KF708_10710 [Pirellulales bacterium]|nr:hypothetical protein [Pirellulales bacterium]